MKKNRLLSVVLSAAMVTSLTACGSGAEKGAAVDSNKETAVQVQEEADGERVTVTFWDDNAGDERTEYYAKIIEDFEAANPDIHIEYLGLSSSDALSKYQTAIAAGETPDVGGVNNAWASTIVGLGHCAELDEMFNAWEGADEMDPGSMDVSRIYDKEGKLYIMPTTTNFMCLWINENMLAEAGLEAPKTWDDFFHAVETLTNKENDQYGYTIRGGAGSPPPLFDLIYSYLGTNEVFDENGNCTVNCDEAVEFVDRFLNLYGTCTPESDITAGYKEISANFDSGVSAIFNHNLGSYGSHVSAFGGEEGFIASPFPTAENGNYVNFGGSISGVCMFDSCENKEAAWKWITYLCEHDANSFWNESIGQLPTNVTCYEDAWMKEKQHIQCAVNQLSQDNTITYTSPTYLPEWGTINSTYIEPAIQSVMAGDMTAKELLDMWAGYLNESYANYMAQ